MISPFRDCHPVTDLAGHFSSTTSVGTDSVSPSDDFICTGSLMQRFLELTDPYSVEPLILVEDPTRPPFHNLAASRTLQVVFKIYPRDSAHIAMNAVLLHMPRHLVSTIALNGLRLVVSVRATPKPTSAPTLAPTRISTIAPTMPPAYAEGASGTHVPTMPPT